MGKYIGAVEMAKAFGYNGRERMPTLGERLLWVLGFRNLFKIVDCNTSTCLQRVPDGAYHDPVYAHLCNGGTLENFSPTGSDPYETLGRALDLELAGLGSLDKSERQRVAYYQEKLAKMARILDGSEESWFNK